MAILYPNEIVNVFIRDVEFTGNMVSVGNDGNYSYDYSSLNTAMDSVSSNTLILVYPQAGTYYTDKPTSSNKNIFVRGMGDSPEDVYIHERSPLQILNPPSYYIVENMKFHGYYSPYGYDHVVLLRQGLDSEVYFNKLFINNTPSYSRGIQLADFEGTNPFTGMLYATSLTMYGYYETSRPWGWVNNNVSAIGIFYSNQPYSCVNCTTAPNPHTYGEIEEGWLGCNSGDFLIKFNVLPEIPPESIPSEPLYQNVWAQGDYIYHTTPSGISVYNSDASSMIGFVYIRTQEEEKRRVVVFNEPTPRNDYSAPVTLSGSDLVYLYSLDGDDIHFQDMSNNELDFWVEHWSYNGVSDLWVKVPASGTTSVYIYFDHDADISYGGGNEAALALFYDDFSVVYPGDTGLGPDWTIAESDVSQFVVSDGKLRVGGTHYDWATAKIDIDKGYNFGMFPIAVTSSIKNTDQPGGVGSTREYSVYLNSALPDPAWHYDSWSWISGLTVPSNDKQVAVLAGYDTQTHYGDGMTLDDSIVTVYFAPDSIRAVAERGLDPFDITFSGTTRMPKLSWLTLFGAYALVYDVDYVKVTRTDNTSVGTTSGTVDTVSYPISAAPTSVWANETDVYIATLGGGVLTTEVPVSGTVVAGTYKREPYISSNNTIYIHGAGDYLAVSTLAGVDRYDLRNNSRIYTYDENIHKCYQTTSGTLYYLENNGFFGADESAEGLGDTIRSWKYYQHLEFDETTQDDSQVRVVFDFNFPYNHTKNAGDDLRFVDPFGQNLAYYVETWHPNATVLVKVPIAGTDSMYMFYGISFALPQSNPDDVYLFYDDFTTLNTDVWRVNLGDANSSVTSNGSYLTIHDYDNFGTEIITKNKFPYGYLRARVRRNGGTTFNQFDGLMGYSSSTSSPVWRGYSYLGLTTGTFETPHRLVPYWASPIQGLLYVSSGWQTWEFVCVEGFQKSVYLGETLSAAGTGVSSENYLVFHQNNTRYEPDLQIDWVSLETWPTISVTTTEEKNLWDLIHPKLHAVYTPNSNWPEADHIYEEFYGRPLLLNDIHVTEDTSSYNNDNTILLATDRGAHVIEERQGDEENADIKRYYIK